MKISIARLKEIIMEEVARATMEQKGGPCQPGQTWEGDEMGEGRCVDLNEESEPLDEGLGETIASPFIKLLNTLLPRITPENREEMLRDWTARLQDEVARNPASPTHTRSFADRYGGDYDITGIAPRGHNRMESLNIEIVED